MPSSSGLPGQGKKIGHRGVDASGETTYKKVIFNIIRQSKVCISTLRRPFLLTTSLHVQYPFSDHIFSLERCHSARHRLHSGQPELEARERCVNAGLLCGGEHLFPQVSILLTTWEHCIIFYIVIWYLVSCANLISNPSWCFHSSEGSNLTPAHHFPDFRFKTYAPVAFRYFRELFGIRPDDYLVRPCLKLCYFCLLKSSETVRRDRPSSKDNNFCIFRQQKWM